MRYEIDIFHYLAIYKKEWKRMVVLILTAMAITITLQLLKPKIYRSTVIALSPAETSAGKIGGFFGFPALSMASSSADTIFAILKSARMRGDINEHFNVQGRSQFWWQLDAYYVKGGFAIEITGSDPEIIKDIANFAAENLDNINLELQITSQKPMITVLDPAVRGAPINKNISKKAIVNALFIFIIYSFYVFYKEYLSHLKILRKPAAR